MRFQLRLHFAQADILAKLQLDQVLLPVHDADRPVLKHLANVPGTEPPLSALVIEILGSLLLVFEIAPSNTCPSNEELAPDKVVQLNHQWINVRMIGMLMIFLSIFKTKME